MGESNSRSPSRRREREHGERGGRRRERRSRSPPRRHERSRSPSRRRDRERSRSPSRKHRKERRHKERRRERRSRSPGRRDRDRGGGGGWEGGGEGTREYAERRARKLARKLRADSIAGYTNEDNPFGDANLTERFVWRKKIARDVEAGADMADELTLDAERRRHAERLAEIEKVKRRREERERERAEHDAEMEQLMRERAMLEFAGWEQKEDEFHAQQARVRSEIRLAEGRAKPVDVLAKQLAAGLDFDFQTKPRDVMAELTEREVLDLREDVAHQLALMEGAGQSVGMEHDFWGAMLLCVDEKLRVLREKAEEERRGRRGKQGQGAVGGSDDIHAEVDSLLEGKSTSALEEMEAQVVATLTGGGAVEVEYWERVKARLAYFKAAALLEDIHAVLADKSVDAQRRAMMEEGAAPVGGPRDPAAAAAEEEERLAREAERADAEEAAARQEAFRATRSIGSPSPEPEDRAELEALGAWPPMDPDEDMQQLRQLRRERARGRGRALARTEAAESASDKKELTGLAAQLDEMTREEQAMGQQPSSGARKMLPDAGMRWEMSQPASRGDKADVAAAAGFRADTEREMGSMAQGEGNYRQEVAVDDGLGGWAHDRFKPRKPLYFNRVSTSYQWNNYNRTHYDFDNPPPKSVSGYKFNIFYPDLIDKSKTPTYKFLPDPASPSGETILIKFHAGAPYEDVAFRVVNGPIAHGARRGQRNTFERGVLRVWYNLEFLRYRK